MNILNVNFFSYVKLQIFDMLIGFQGHISYSTHRLFIGECLLIDIFLVYEYVFFDAKKMYLFICQKCHFLTCKYVVGGIFLIALRDQSVVIVCPCSLVNHQSINIAALILSMQMMIFVDRQICLVSEPAFGRLQDTPW